MTGLRKRSRTPTSTRDKLVADICRRYEKGASIRAIAESTGRSYGFVHRTLTEAGVTLRGRRGARTNNLEREPRETAHRLLEEVPLDRVPAVVELLRKEVGITESVPRRFRTIGVFAGEPDLAARSKEIARQEMGGSGQST